MQVPMGYHRISKFINGRELTFLREGPPRPEQPNEMRKEKDAGDAASSPPPLHEETITTPADQSILSANNSSLNSAQPLKKRWRET